MDKAEQPAITQADIEAAEQWRFIECMRCSEYEGDFVHDLAADFARHRTTSLAAQDGLVCTGCGSTKSIEQIRAEHPSALSCCPERKMVSQIGDIVERLNCLHVWPQSIASTYADTLTPRQIERLYDVGNVATEAASTIATLRKQLAAQDGLVKALQTMIHAVCGETGFANAVRGSTGKAYPWPALDIAEEKARKALSAIKEQHHD